MTRMMLRRILFNSIALALAVQVARGQNPADTSRPNLPALLASDSLSAAKAKADEVLNTRLRQLEAELKELHATIDKVGAPTAARLDAIEKAFHLREQRDQLERTRALALRQAEYTNGYQLYRETNTRLGTLNAAVASVAAYQSITDLADLRSYPGFDAAYQRILGKVKDDAERGWLNNLVSAVAPKILPGMTAAAIQPLLGLAGIAVSKLQSVLPAFAKENFKGGRFVETVDQLSCGLGAANAIYEGVTNAALQNVALGRRVDSLRTDFRSAISDYTQLIGANTAMTDNEVYLKSATFFNTLNSLPQDTLNRAIDGVASRTRLLQSHARDYAQAVYDHIQYWQRLRAVIEARNNLACVSSDSTVKAKYAAALSQIDNTIASIRAAYLFEGGDSRGEYFRLLTR